MTEQDAREQAKKEAEFYTHLATFLVTMAGLTVLNLLVTPGHLWVLYALFGWGIGIGNHASEVFGLGRGSNWQHRRVQELMNREPSVARLRSLLDEELDARALPAGEPQDVDRLQRRIEHLEAIVTSRDWDEVARDTAPSPLETSPQLDLDELADAPESAEAEAARLARRVR
ncbi:MAG: 2TM domain-containing protein [Bacteroidota bacterium]